MSSYRTLRARAERAEKVARTIPGASKPYMVFANPSANAGAWAITEHRKGADGKPVLTSYEVEDLDEWLNGTAAAYDCTVIVDDISF